MPPSYHHHISVSLRCVCRRCVVETCANSSCSCACSWAINLPGKMYIHAQDARAQTQNTRQVKRVCALCNKCVCRRCRCRRRRHLMRCRCRVALCSIRTPFKRHTHTNSFSIRACLHTYPIHPFALYSRQQHASTLCSTCSYAINIYIYTHAGEAVGLNENCASSSTRNALIRATQQLSACIDLTLLLLPILCQQPTFPNTYTYTHMHITYTYVLYSSIPIVYPKNTTNAIIGSAIYHRRKKKTLNVF